MEPNLPPELQPRRDAIYTQVTRRGRARRRRRVAAVALAATVTVLAPIAAVALTVGHDGRTPHLVVVDRSSSTTGATTSLPPNTTTSSVASTTTSSTPDTTISTRPETTTTVLVCHNSTNPACGPFSYDPPLVNQPATLTVERTEPAAPRAGDTVTFTLHAHDPDSSMSPGIFCGQISYGDGISSGCSASCAGTPAQYGPWSPPPPTPGDETYTLTHVYAQTGSFRATFSIVAGQCGPRPSTGSASATVVVAG